MNWWASDSSTLLPGNRLASVYGYRRSVSSHCWEATKTPNPSTPDVPVRDNISRWWSYIQQSEDTGHSTHSSTSECLPVYIILVFHSETLYTCIPFYYDGENVPVPDLSNFLALSENVMQYTKNYTSSCLQFCKMCIYGHITQKGIRELLPRK